MLKKKKVLVVGAAGLLGAAGSVVFGIKIEQHRFHLGALERLV